MDGFKGIRDPEIAAARLKRLNDGFRAVSGDIDRSTSGRWLPPLTARQSGLFVLMAGLVAIGGAVCYAELAHPGWALATKLKHIAAAPDCTTAHAVGLAPAERGEPGYDFRHDRDQHGIACEPRPTL